MKNLASTSLAAATFTFLAAIGVAPTARAQSTLYETDFASADGWALEVNHGWAQQSNSPEWAVDALPMDPAFAPYRSGPTSLNFNHNDEGLAWGDWAGSATSPEIDLADTLGTPQLSFWYAFEHEIDCEWDAFSVEVIDSSTGSVLFSECLSATSLGHREWVEFNLDLDRAWGSIQVRFSHDTLDPWNLNEVGSYVDDLKVVDPRGATLHCEGEPLFDGSAPAQLSMQLIGHDPAGPVHMQGDGFPANGYAFAFAGPHPGMIQIGHGLRCIGASGSVRLSLVPTGATGRPSWTLDPSTGNFTQMAMLDVPIYVQTIFRDGPSPNLSDALVFHP